MSRNDELTDVNARYREIINRDIIYRVLKLALAVLHDGISICHGRNYFLLLFFVTLLVAVLSSFNAVVEKRAYL